MNTRPFLQNIDPAPLMDDLELIAFLLESRYVENQLRVEEDFISVELISDFLPEDFFLELSETGRKYTVCSGEVIFETSHKMKIAK